jgi:sarcosine oxidase subunit gamma
MAAPSDHLRRTPLAPALHHAGVSWIATGDCAIAVAPGGEVRRDKARALGIADLSPLPRIGFKGRETIPAMQRRGITVEPTPNRAFRQRDGSLCLVLAASEVVILGPLSGEGSGIDQLQSSWSIEDGERTYPLCRRDSHAWLAITGTKSAQMFAKICGIDLRPEKFSDLTIAQTSVAKLSAIVVRSDIAGTLAFHVLADSASALYFFDCILDAAREFGGQIVDLETLQILERG